jgi:hypothetical protein
LSGDFGDDFKMEGELFVLDGHKLSGAVARRSQAFFLILIFVTYLTGLLHNLAVPTITVGVVTTRLYNAV